MNSVPLTPRTAEVKDRIRLDGPIWATNANKANAPAAASIETKCDVSMRPNRICCRQDKAAKSKRTLIKPEVIRDIILGASDGLTVPFGITAGLAATGSSHIVVVGGVAELISGAISMGIGGFLSAQAERDHFRYMWSETQQRLRESCRGEIEREVYALLSPYGLDEISSVSITSRLMAIETASTSRQNGKCVTAQRRHELVQNVLQTISRQPRFKHDDSCEAQTSAKTDDDQGMAAFLLKFSEGEEEVPNWRLFTSAFTIGISYIVFGMAPLFPYFFINAVYTALFVSIGITAAVLVLFGLAKAYYTGGAATALYYFKSTISTVLLGATAAGIAYGVGYGLEHSNIGK